LRTWLTTQWPHLRSTRQDAPHNGVWVADDKRDVIAPMAIHDLVWIYESQSGRPILQEKATGEKVTRRHHRGRGGVVALVEVIETPAEDPDSEVESYIDGTSIWWRWRADTRTVNSAGFVNREELNRMMGFERAYVFRGFGTRRSGLKEISPETHSAILNAFLASYTKEDQGRLRRGSNAGRAGEGGEGPVHKKLKEAIAADPCAVLGEPGLELVKMEYVFGATGDRIDVLLKDRFGRYMAVEVEPACPADHVSGPLQCMKYRSLLAYHLDREPEEIRTCLVTHDLHEEVQKKSKKYGIQSVIVEAAAAHVS